MLRRFAAEGASVVVADINQDAIDAVLGELRASGAATMGFKVDVTSSEQLKELMKATKAQFGRVDILVNNAGLIRRRPFLTMNDEDWNIVLGVCLKGAFYGAQAVAEYMIEQRSGKIVNISSASGTGAALSISGVNYQAAKAAVIQLTKTLAKELGPHGINVNCIAPGDVGIPMVDKSLPKGVTVETKNRSNVNALNRAGKPEDVANAALFLVSDEADYISGHLLCVDGGRTDRM
jgi:NAD(P)-dependent dehydrogenase (short-subunit alcohol dehydrogenase family)